MEEKVGSPSIPINAPALSRALVLIVVQAIIVFVLGIGIGGRLLLPDPENPFLPSAGLAVLFALVFSLTIAVVYFGSCRRPGRTLKKIGWTGEHAARIVLFGLGGAAGCVIVLAVILIATGESIRGVGAMLLAPSVGQRLVFLAIGLHAAFTEETLFRGNLLSSLQVRMGSLPALVIMSAVFAFYHLQFNPIALLAKFTFGIIFGLLRLKTGSLYAPAVAHSLVWVIAGSM
jgi:membrane protease YdiL (CAAX protease family)